MEPVFVFISLFAAVFGIAYLYYSTRNKERLALIEKGADASIFAQKRSGIPAWKIFTLNSSLVLIGMGLAFFIAHGLHTYAGLEESIAIPGSIFLMAGIGLFIGLKMSRKLEAEHRGNSGF